MEGLDLYLESDDGARRQEEEEEEWWLGGRLRIVEMRKKLQERRSLKLEVDVLGLYLD